MFLLKRNHPHLAVWMELPESRPLSESPDPTGHHLRLKSVCISASSSETLLEGAGQEPYWNKLRTAWDWVGPSSPPARPLLGTVSHAFASKQTIQRVRFTWFPIDHIVTIPCPDAGPDSFWRCLTHPRPVKIHPHVSPDSPRR